VAVAAVKDVETVPPGFLLFQEQLLLNTTTVRRQHYIMYEQPGINLSVNTSTQENRNWLI
jgi:hypothetical protein